MKIEDLAAILGKTKEQVEKMFMENEVIELKLTELEKRKDKEEGELKIIQ